MELEPAADKVAVFENLHTGHVLGRRSVLTGAFKNSGPNRWAEERVTVECLSCHDKLSAVVWVLAGWSGVEPNAGTYGVWENLTSQ